ncbi:TonB-dependent receptor [Myroides odoratimimus]|uniref:TonB-dependent receptor n=1 Tax=Myroides odoratimimus TaxID=76832 RepID=UPI0021800B49|nr:TonB-dependent receptor [Myroides odoratimimus]MCS7472824.1 TonB-dependent receptor [Myroides odoratimimus]MDM1508479.1 carboxypeptidase-like regulatory domain-containing protein [Myroides odoratimimus]MDM1518913.1 carboxypeptidase-like regulatory domain-containing protein [Myroides odoratimimus]MDM1525074.1 carboxypeptidase-like regulatory domain-containing protein [Myroides odoratimimus]MDM1678571.1 carboxypeptidase-like regulatory domain-containing protein [Myroides odoratimimus]
MFLYICCENNFITYTYKMKNLKNWMLMMVMVFTSVSALSQNKITGVVIDGEFQSGLPGAAIIVKGTLNGASSDMDGKFELNVSEDKGEVVISFIGYQSKTVAFKVGADKKVDLGTVVLATDQNMLDDIVIMGVADVAKDRKTPVAVSTIKAAEIQEKLGSQEFPEILNTTPSVYASKGGGGYGDSNINIRGFDQKNIAVLINGMPVNDMEGGSVYWSNWAGLSDVTSAMQVQRGLGSSKLAISSVGGTINVLTRTSDAREGGSISAGVGNNDYFKGLASYNTGVLENGLSASILLGYTRGNGYVEGTGFEGVNYYLGLGYKSKDSRHNLQFTFTGAKQDHDQRSTSMSIENIKKYNNGELNKRYNPDTGFYNGERFNFKSNYYNKPVMSLNYDFNINETWTFGTVVYASWGRGGGTGTIGGGPSGYRDFGTEVRDANGHMRFDDIAAWNRGETVADWKHPNNIASEDGKYYVDTNYKNAGDGGWARRSSINSHDWYGTVMNMNAKVNDNWTVDFGLDARIYKGYHYQLLDNLMGADGFVVNNNKNYTGSYVVSQTYDAKASMNPWVDWNGREKVGYHNDGNVKWLGGFGQVEYSKDNLSVFVQGAISNQWMQRVDYFNHTADSGEQKTSWESILGGNVKGGVNYNINENHNVFFNTGYYSRQPFMNNGVFLNNSNTINPSSTNEKIFGLEAGYGFRSEKFRANVNVYRTSWDDRVLRASTRYTSGGKENNATATLSGIEQIHTGVEMDFLYNPIDRLNITGSFSWGDWKYASNVSGIYYDEENNTPIYNTPGDPNSGFKTQTLYIDGAKVGGAPQFIINLGANYEIAKGLKIDANYRYNDNFYGSLAIDKADAEGKSGSMKLPAFNLFDAGLSYRLPVGKEKTNSVTMRVNVNNVFDTTYISSARTNYEARPGEATWKGVSEKNEVLLGAGRTWNFTLRYNF